MAAVKYNWPERFKRTRFTVLAEEYRPVTAHLFRWQIWNAAQKYAPGKRVRIRVTDDGDLVVRVERRVRLTPPKEKRDAAGAA